MAGVKGILGTKLGMTQIFEDTRAIPVTVINAGPCYVAQVKSEEKDGYRAVQLAFAEPSRHHATKPMQGHFDKHGGKPGRYVVELRTDDAGAYAPGQELKADVFAPGDLADVVAHRRPPRLRPELRQGDAEPHQGFRACISKVLRSGPSSPTRMKAW